MRYGFLIPLAFPDGIVMYCVATDGIAHSSPCSQVNTVGGWYCQSTLDLTVRQETEPTETSASVVI